MPCAARWMDLETVILSQMEEVIAYTWNLKKKKGTSELIYKTEIELQMWKTNLWLLPEGKQQGKI